MSTEADNRAIPTQQTSAPSFCRALVASGTLSAVVAWVYLGHLAKLSPAGGDRWALWPLVAVGVWASCAHPVKIRTRKMSMAIGLTEIPTLVGIVFLSPLAVLAAVFCGHLVVNLRHRRRFGKAINNCLVYLVAVSVGISTYDYGIAHSSPVHARGWVVSTIAVTAIAFVNLVLVLTVMAFADRRWRRPPLMAIVVQAGLYIAVCTAGGLVAVSLVWMNTWGIALFVAIALATNLAYHTTVASGQRYANLEKLYDFTRRLSRLAEGRDVMVTVLEEARTLLNAGRAELVIPLEAPFDSFVLRCSLDGEGEPGFEEGVPCSDLDLLVAERGAMLFDGRSTDAGLGRAMKKRGLTEALIAPLQREDLKAGYLLVADPPVQRDGFKQPDLRFLETLAANAGVALRSSELLEKLRREVAVRQHQAHHDTLTDLPNRLFFTERLEEALVAAGSGKVAVMLIDLDGFKEVNDTLGHVMGDSILREVASRLAPFSGETSLVARLGGDEFAVLLACEADDLAIETTGDQVLTAIRRPFAVEGLVLDIRASIGVAVAPPQGRQRDGTNLMRHADVAMYQAKGSGGGVRFYHPAEDHSTLRRLTLATELRRAIEQQSLELWYQPVVQLSTGQVLGCEALLRWTHEQFGPISPVEFIPVAESGGLIDPLTWWVLDTALAQLKTWREIVPGLIVAVNMSARSFSSATVPERVEEALTRARMGPETLTLELTESAMMADPATSRRAMHNLRELGVNLSIDDYGTGFSSLSRLKDLPFQELKIDQSFVKDLIHDKGDQAIVRSTIELAHNLGRTVTAEGVEDKATLQRLASLGCHAAQGYYLARPLPVRECENWLSTSTRWPNTMAPDECDAIGRGLTGWQGNP